MTDELRHRRLWLAIFALGMVLRVLWAVFVPVEPVSDSGAYDVFARNLAQHGVFGWTPDEPSAYWAVGTSALVAATYLVLGDSYLGVVLLNLVASALILPLTHALGRRYFGPVTGLWAMALVALWPNLIFFTSILSSELFFIALCLGGLFFWDRREGSWVGNLLLCGLIWGLACYVRPVILLLPVALLIADVPKGLGPLLRTGLRCLGVILLIVAVVSPWTLRNQREMGAPVLVSTNFGPNLWMGNNPDSNGGYMELPPTPTAMTEVERATYFGDLAKAYMLEYPLKTAMRTLRKAVSLHSRETIGIAWNAAALQRGLGSAGVTGLKLVATGYWFVILGLALAGIGLRLRQAGFLGAIFHPTVAIWAYFTALHAVIVVEDRYHMPSSPYIAILSAVALTALWQRWRPPHSPERAT